MTICTDLLCGTLNNNWSEIHQDETIRFFSSAAWLNEETDHWQIPIHAWVYEPQDSYIRKNVIAQALNKKYGLKTNPQTRENFNTRINLLIADNERGKVDTPAEIREDLRQRSLLPKAR